MKTSIFHLIQQFPRLKVLVIGEAMLDAYLQGHAERICREAPVPVVAVEERQDVPGGGANTAVNAASLGAQVTFLSVVGDDAEGERLQQSLWEHGVTTEGVIVEPERATLAKHRIMAADQIIVRYDQGDMESIQPDTEAQLIEKLRAHFPQCDALIISDYGYGVLTPRIIETIAQLQAEHLRVIVSDSKRLWAYRAVQLTAAKPNYGEVLPLLGETERTRRADRVAQVLAGEEAILARVSAQIVAVTVDMDGAVIFERGCPPYRTYATPVPYSSTAGAGDTFVSALSLALAAGAYTHAAAEIAAAAANVVVQKDGTAICSQDELIESFSRREKMIPDAFRLAARIAAYRRQGRRIVFTNGCFDILHRGHIAYLNQAKARGDVLVVGLNSDQSVRYLKGSNRPVNRLEDRSQVLAALSCVDHIVPFGEPTPHRLIRLIRPDVFVKGGDYTEKTLPEAPLVHELGGQVEILPFVEDYSTSSIIERIRKIYA